MGYVPWAGYNQVCHLTDKGLVKYLKCTKIKQQLT